VFGLSTPNLSGDTRRVPTVQANGVALHYEESGTGDPILCVHGTGSSSELWADAVAALSARGRAVVYDRRGFGRSERPQPLRMDVRLHGDDAAALLEALDAAPAVVIGRSQGGEIALDLALRHPGRVRALVLLEGGGLRLSDEAVRLVAAADERVFAAAEQDPGAVGRTLLDAMLGDGVWDELPEVVRRTFTDNGPAIVAEERAGLLRVTAEELRAISVPTLAVGAEDSPEGFRAWVPLVAGAIPNARTAWVEGGHLIDASHPAVLAFVDDVLGAG
jgi:pimeloyl-ACP methyl ester carboxylesterase